MLNFLAQTSDVQFWDKLLSGQVGFILATLMFGAFFWKVLLPRWDRQTNAIEKLADAVRLVVVHNLEEEGKKPDEILSAVDKMAGR